MTERPLKELLRPQSIAVVGASVTDRGGGQFVISIKEQGFKNLYPVNPKYQELFGLKTYPGIKDIPGPVDYVISSVPSHHVLNLIDDCIHKGVKIVHLFTARFSETGRRDAIELEQEVLKKARSAGIRIIGPNCMGVYYPEVGLSFMPGCPQKSGKAGFISQSGSVAGEIIELCSQRGVYFSKGISYGNAIDLNECDFLEYLSGDPETDIILMYIEGVRDGRRFFNTLRRVTPKKPVIIIKGGRGASGTRATASHTASLAGSAHAWNAAITQAGAISASNVDELIDLTVASYFLPPIRGYRVGVIGGAGGTSVTAADLCEEAGLDVVPLPETIRHALKASGNEVWDWISNPVDFSILPRGGENFVEMLKLMVADPGFDLIINFMNSFQLQRLAQAGPENILGLFPEKNVPDNNPILIALEDRRYILRDQTGDNLNFILTLKDELAAAGFPIFWNIESAARASFKLINYYKKKAARGKS